MTALLSFLLARIGDIFHFTDSETGHGGFVNREHGDHGCIPCEMDTAAFLHSSRIRGQGQRTVQLRHELYAWATVLLVALPRSVTVPLHVLQVTLYVNYSAPVVTQL